MISKRYTGCFTTQTLPRERKDINVFSECMHMVRVITIMDDVYAELYRLKRSKDMSFSEAIRYLLKEQSKEGKSIINLAGSISEMDIDRRAVGLIKRGRGVLGWKSPE